MKYQRKFVVHISPHACLLAITLSKLMTAATELSKITCMYVPTRQRYIVNGGLKDRSARKSTRQGWLEAYQCVICAATGSDSDALLSRGGQGVRVEPWQQRLHQLILNMSIHTCTCTCTFILYMRRYRMTYMYIVQHILYIGESTLMYMYIHVGVSNKM